MKGDCVLIAKIFTLAARVLKRNALRFATGDSR